MYDVCIYEQTENPKTATSRRRHKKLDIRNVFIKGTGEECGLVKNYKCHNRWVCQFIFSVWRIYENFNPTQLMLSKTWKKVQRKWQDKKCHMLRSLTKFILINWGFSLKHLPFFVGKWKPTLILLHFSPTGCAPAPLHAIYTTNKSFGYKNRDADIWTDGKVDTKYRRASMTALGLFFGWPGRLENWFNCSNQLYTCIQWHVFTFWNMCR